jgi:hypothetical protein
MSPADKRKAQGEASENPAAKRPKVSAFFLHAFFVRRTYLAIHQSDLEM